MLLSLLWRWFPGWVRVEAEGGYPERLLNRLAQEERPVWSVRCRRESTWFSCLAGDYRALRHPARQACVRLRVRQKHGLPFWLFRYRRRKGLLVALALYGILLAVLSTRVWVIRVVGNAQTPENSIRTVAEEMGIRVGMKTSAMDIKKLEIEGLDRLPSLSWITANPSGCVVRLEVTERRPTPSVLDLSTPSDVVALRDGRILSMEVFSGQKTVLVGEAVKAGTLLITGRVESELGDHWYRAYGEVWAETRRQLTVGIPLTYWKVQPTGFTALCPTLTFLSWQIPLYSRGSFDDTYHHTQKSHFLTANGLTLPLGITNDYYIRTERKKTARTQQQAGELAAQQLKKREEAVFAGLSYEELSRREWVERGQYCLTVTYRCRENIAREVPRALEGSTP